LSGSERRVWTRRGKGTQAVVKTLVFKNGAAAFKPPGVKHLDPLPFALLTQCSAGDDKMKVAPLAHRTTGTG
jgi:hypothetical protein